MSKSSAEFRDKTYQLSESNACHLSVQVDRDAFSYSITEADSGVVRAVYRYTGVGNPLESSWKESLRDIEDLQQEYRSAVIAVNHVPFVLLPASLDEEVGSEEVFKANFNSDPANLCTAVVTEGKINIAFDMPPGLDEEFHLRQPYAIVTHSGAMMIRSILQRHRFSKGTTCYLNITESAMEVVVLKDNRLELYNWFPYLTRNDVLYHLVNIASQLGFDPGLTPVHITGIVDSGDETFELLKTYWPKLSLLYSLDSVKLSLGLHGVRKPYFSSLFNLFACV
ncbi:MAG: DUF3822 family protein [Flavobacteriales bacterium]|nr:DUF3822 family protein [Flavobacteriales bacterium]